MRLQEIAASPESPNVSVAEFNRAKQFILNRGSEVTAFHFGSDKKLNVEGNIMLETRATHIPYKFGTITRDFYCAHTALTSLEGSPSIVGGTFDCSYSTTLRSLVGGPHKVGKIFNCSGTKIVSLAGGPREVGTAFNCAGTPIVSLEGAPVVIGGDFDCSKTKISSFVGAPKEIHGTLFCHNCSNLKTLSGIEKHIQYIKGYFYVNENVTHVLGLVMIKGLSGVRVDGGQIDNIINKYIGTGDILSCQDELLDAGFKEQARL